MPRLTRSRDCQWNDLLVGCGRAAQPRGSTQHLAAALVGLGKGTVSLTWEHSSAEYQTTMGSRAGGQPWVPTGWTPAGAAQTCPPTHSAPCKH